jgi:hypothetical protein
MSAANSVTETDFGRWRVGAKDRIFPVGTEVDVRWVGGRILVASRSFTHVLEAPHATASDDARALRITWDSQLRLLVPLEGQDPEVVAREMNADLAVATL